MILKSDYLRLMLSTFILAVIVLSCKKEDSPTPITQPKDSTVITPPVEPAIANTIGFFLNDWQPKTFTLPDFTEAALPSTASTIVTVDASAIITKIPQSAFGQNANIWMSTMINEPLFMNHITALKPHVIRFPAGSGSDVYFWNAKPGALPADVPATLPDKDGVNKDPGFGFGKTTDDWRASLDNYYDMLKQSNNTGVLTVNYGYARYGTSDNPVAVAAHLAADWVRYDNGRTKYWEIGNEVYADWEWSYRIDLTQNKDGQPQLITGKLYAQHVKVFADSMRKAAAEIGATIYIGAVMYESVPAAYQANSFKTWNTTMLPELNNAADFYIAHNYFTPYNENSTASTIWNAALTEPAKMMTFLTQTMTSNGVDIKPVAMTEYNMWAMGAKQQVSNISGSFAVLVISEALTNKYGLTARWDLLNSWNNGDDHGLFSDGNEPGVPKWTPRPSFYYLYFFQKSIGDRLVKTTLTSGSSNVKAYGSTYSSGQVNVTLVNTSAVAQNVEVKLDNFKMGARFYWYSLEGSNDNGEFSRKVLVNGFGPSGIAGGPGEYATLKARSAVSTAGVKVSIPARGMACVMIDN